MFFIPVLVPIYTSRGFSMQEILFAESVFYITIFIAEIPTGAIADLFGKKYCMAVSSMGSAISCSLLYYTNSYIWLIISQIVFGIAMTFSSGADSAYLYEILKENDQDANYSRYEGKAYSFTIIFSNISIALGGVILMYIGTSAPFLFSTIFYFMAALVSLSLPITSCERNHRVKFQGFIKKYCSQIKQTFIIMSSNKKLGNFSLIFGIFFTVTQLSIWINQIYLEKIGVPVALFGVIIAALSVGSLLVSWNIGTIMNKLSTNRLILISCLVVVFSFLFLGLITTLYSLVILMFLNGSKGLFFPIIKQEINIEIPNEYRATVLSTQSSLGNLLFALIAPIYGILLDIYPLKNVLAFTSLLLLFSFFIPFYNLRTYFFNYR